MFRQHEPDEPWFVYVTDERYPVRWGPFRREQAVQIGLVLNKAGTVDALISALQQIRQTME